MNLCLQFTPGSNPGYNSVNWSSVVTESSALKVSFTSFQYSLGDGSLCTAFQYSSDINQNALGLKFNFPSTAPFALLSSPSASVRMKSDNNLALKAYSSDDYVLADSLRVIIRGLSFIMLFFLIVGLIRYKIVPLEASAVYQVAVFSLIALQDISPTLSALDELSFIAYGYRFNFFS